MPRVIEVARAGDVDQLNDLVRQLRPDLAKPAFDPDAVRQGRRTLVARDSARGIIGLVVVAYIDVGVPDEGGGTIELLVVDEAERGRGVGAALVREARHWLSGEGVGV